MPVRLGVEPSHALCEHAAVVDGMPAGHGQWPAQTASDRMSAIEGLARFLASDIARQLDENVRYEAQRLLIDWLGCVLAGIDAPALDLLPARGERHRETVQATVPGSGERLGLPAVAALGAAAAAASGFAAEHPRSPLPLAAVVAGALMPLATARAARGAAALDAYACGIEVGMRLAEATIARGGNGLGAAGIAASAACAHLLRLDTARMQRALEAAALAESALSAGSPSLAHIAEAARSGLAAALRAQENAAAATRERDDAFRPPDPWPGVIGARVLEDLGRSWLLQAIAYRTYPCSRSLHPAVEACQALQLRYRTSAADIEAVELHAHPAALAGSLRDPQDDAQARSSLHHVAAAALLHGTSARQFDARELRSERLARLRARVEAVGDEAVGRDGIHVRLRLRNGNVLEQRLRCARGAPARPLGDAELAAKFRHLAGNALATSQTERLLALAWNMPALADAGALVRASVPEEEIEAVDVPGSPLIPR
jgi:2-methylcitrate dehydratase PrpD